ncbi:MAG: FGGY family carbohydrate kinase [Actinomycetota bacterium]
MAQKLLLGIDLGSSGVKAILLDPERGIVASASHEVDLFSDQPGWAEADTDQWWTAVVSLVPKLLVEANVTKDDVSGIATSGMVPAVVCVNEAGLPLRRAMLQNDARATAEISELRASLAEVDLLRLTGSILSQQSVAPTALWLARNEPKIWAETKHLVGSYDWMLMRMGAPVHVEKNWALESGLYDLELNPLLEVTAATGIVWPQLAEVKSPSSPVGNLSSSAASQLGLLAGTPLFVGGADHVLSAYGAGLVNAGDVLVKLGGAGDILAVTDEVFVDSRLYLDAHPIPGKWLPNGCMATSGSLLRWEQALFGGLSLTELDDQAENSQPGALLALPYFLGEKTPLHDPNLRGVIAGLHLGTTRGDIHRSFLEAIAYGFRSHFEILAEGGVRIGSVRITNGGSKSRLWRQILADVLNRDLISIINHPGASYGAAVMAGLGSGAISDWSYVAGSLEPGEIISPNPDNVARYAKRYEEFVALTAATTEFSHLLARSQS